MKHVAPIIAIAAATALVACTSTEKAQQNEFALREVASVASNEPPVTTNFIEEINDAGFVASKSELLSAKSRMEKIFASARATSIDFFRELRVREPIFESKGANFSLNVMGKERFSKSIPNLYILTKNVDVRQALDANTVFTVKPYEFIMDATVGEYMLSNENHYTNAEKPPMRHMLNRNDLPRVRKIVAQLAKEAIAKGVNERGELDVVASVSRDVPLGLNSEYFGFPGPSRDKMAQWSRHTQHAFFHNPFRDEKVFQASRDSGKEMTTYIGKVLLPSRKAELANGRPAYDPVSRMIAAAGKHAEHGLNPDRLVSNVAGLLVGSVETTSAAITQSLDFIMSHPNILEGATKAARAGDDKKLDAYVWEALRFNTVNPWVARYTSSDYTVAEGTERQTKIPKGSLVLISTESAMFDADVFVNPDKFRLDRPQDSYMHLGYGYHRCLGDDVSLVMVPETIKQILLLPGLRRANPKKGIDQKGGPFPESFVVKVNVPGKPPLIERFEKSVNGTLAYLGLADFVVDKLVNMEQRRKAIAAIRNIAVGNPAQRQQAIDELPALVANAMKDVPKADITKACMEKNPKSVDAFADPGVRKAYCETRIDFRACYFAERLINKKSSQHSWNHCAYGRNLLNSSEREDFKQRFKNEPLFSFLSFE